MFTDPKLILMIGIPGSGKSAWLYDNNFKVVVSPDLIRKEMFGDITDQSHNNEVWEEAKSRTIDYLLKGISVVIDATNVSTSYRRMFVQDLPPCKLQAKIFNVGPVECCDRIKKDLETNKDRSTVPDEVVFRMYGEFLYTLRVIKSEGFELI